jgi:DNA-binding GntR family transcriptional regulator
MSINPVKPPSGANEEAAASLVSFVVDAIIDGVMKGHYAPGQRLIAADLAEEFNVSRAPVREALHMLAGEGVVELIANRGARIRRLSVGELIDFLEFTEAICALGVRLATGRMSEVDSCYTANQAFQRIEDAYTRRHNRDFVEALYRYHIELNRLSGNQYLEFFYRRPYIRFYTILLADLTPGEHWEQYILNYRMIHDMILSGDAHSSVTSFVGHIRWVLRNMRNDDSA